MYARVLSAEASDPSIADEVIAAIRDYMLPRAREQKGYKGYFLLGDRNTGRSIGITLWETEEDRAATGPGSAYFVENMAKLGTLTPNAPEIYDMEVLIQD